MISYCTGIPWAWAPWQSTWRKGRRMGTPLTPVGIIQSLRSIYMQRFTFKPFLNFRKGKLIFLKMLHHITTLEFSLLFLLDFLHLKCLKANNLSKGEITIYIIIWMFNKKTFYSGNQREWEIVWQPSHLPVPVFSRPLPTSWQPCQSFYQLGKCFPNAQVCFKPWGF